MKKFSTVIKFLITIFLIFWAYKKIDKSFFYNFGKNFSFEYLLIALFIFLLSNFTGAVQWFFLLKSQKINIKFGEVLNAYFVGTFFNNFMPSNIGGDIVKAYKIIKKNKNSELIISSIFWDRAISLLILLFFSLISAFFLFKKFLFLIITILLIILFFFFSFLIIKFNLGNFVLKLVDKIPYENAKIFLKSFLKSFKHYIIFSKNIFIFYLISIITQYLKIFIQVLINISYNFNLKLSEIYFLIPLIGIISALPISINGIGLREILGKNLAFIIKKPENVLVFFLSIGNIIIIFGNLFGAIFWFKEPKKDILKRGIREKIE